MNALDMLKESEGLMGPLFEEEQEKRGASVELHVITWDKLDEIADRETDKRRKSGRKGKVSRNKVVQELLNFAIAEYWKRETATSKKK